MRREPALIIGATSAVLSLLVAFGVDGLSHETAALLVALVTAASGAVAAWRTRPIAPAAFTAVVTAAADLLAGYGYGLSPEQIASVNGVLLVVLSLLTRGQVTPVAGPVSPELRPAR